jgi:serine/threonine-protein kinase
LSAGLDGIGPLRTVPPTVAVRRWTGRADIPSAERLADDLGAGLAVFGRVLSSGPDSLRISASLYDAAERRLVGTVDVEGPLARASAVSDSLAIRLLRELGRTRPVGAVRSVALGSASLPALRAYLSGEQAFRSASWDSAIGFYERAVELDSGFTLAMSRLSRALAWRPETRLDSRVAEYAIAAGSRNRGLAPRESLLVAADSLRAALAFSSGPSYLELQRREFATLRDGLRRYPNDPEMWHRFGDALFHEGMETGASWDEVLNAFDRAIALDSAFTPSYEHALQVSLWEHGPDRWRPYQRTFLELSDGPDAVPFRIVGDLIDRGSDDPAIQAVFDTLDLEQLGTVFQTLSRWPDRDESAIAVARVGAARTAVDHADAPVWHWRMSGSLAYRGRMADALALGPPLPWDLVAEAALLGIPLPEATAQAFESNVLTYRRADLLAPWLSMRGDTVALRSLIDRVEPKSGSDRMGDFQRAVASAYLNLARGDSASALQQLLTLPDGVCRVCYLPRLTRVHLLVQAGRYRDADYELRNELPTPPALGRPADVLWGLERARVAEALGRREDALREYTVVADTWVGADAELQGYREEALVAIQRLGSAGESATSAR